MKLDVRRNSKIVFYVFIATSSYGSFVQSIYIKLCDRFE